MADKEAPNQSRIWFKRAMRAETNQATLRGLLAEAREIINEGTEAWAMPVRIKHFLQQSERALKDIPEEIEPNE